MTEENEKIATESKSFRLPVDVIALLNRWAEETKCSPTVVLCNTIRVAAEDERRILQDSGENSAIQEEDVLQVVRPESRDSLANAISLLMYETRKTIGERDQISALGVARARIYKATDEYKAAQAMRDKSGIPSIYEDEQKYADELSSRQ